MKTSAKILIFLLPFNLYAISASGNLKSYPIMRELPGMDRTYVWQNSGKLQVEQNLPFDSRMEIGYELTSYYKKHTRHVSVLSPYRYDDLNGDLHHEDRNDEYRFSLSQNLNRANVSTKTFLGDLIVGRQTVAFGSAKSINPTDVLVPFSPDSIDKEERGGVDAIVAKVPINELSLVEFGTVSGEKFQKTKSAFYVRPKFNYEKFDVALTAMNFKKNDLYGVDVQHPLWDAGFWLEAAYLIQKRTQAEDFFRFTTGVDYKFKNTLYLAMEYHYNGAAQENKRLYPEDFIFLRSKHYFIPTFSYELTPLLTLWGQAYYNANDKSFYPTAKLDYNFIENFYCTLGTFQGFGNEKSTEFGPYGEIYYGSIRYYF